MHLHSEYFKLNQSVTNCNGFVTNLVDICYITIQKTTQITTQKTTQKTIINNQINLNL